MSRPSRPLIAGLIASMTAVSLAACSTDDVASSGSAQSAVSASVNATAAEGSIFDASQSHTVSLDIEQDALDELLQAYQDGNEKTYVKANITIDGVTYNDVGVRLKGNSSLRSLGGTNQMPGGGAAPSDAAAPSDGQAPAGMPTDMPTPPSDGAMPTDMPQPGGANGPGGQGGGGMSGSGIDENDPTTWPLLINFDKYVDGQTYNGMTQIALRYGVPSVNEAAALTATAMTGQASQQFGYVTYSVNGGDTLTRIMLVNPDENYAANLGDGILYKSDSESSFTYQGDDDSTYEDQFKQVSDGDTNEQPIIDLLKWLDSADDEEFDNNLDTYVDVDSFAKYLATQNLLVNQDDMAGPGKNYYLWYDNETKKISIISWDLDMSMQGNAELGVDDTASMGGGGGRGGNELKERFLASDKFKAIYEDAYWDLYDQIYGSDALSQAVDKLNIPATDGLSQDEIDQAKQKVQDFITQRKDYLATQKA